MQLRAQDCRLPQRVAGSLALLFNSDSDYDSKSDSKSDSNSDYDSYRVFLVHPQEAGPKMIGFCLSASGG